MKIVSLIVITLILTGMVLTGVILSSSAYAQPNPNKFVPNRLLVKFNDDISDNQKHLLLEQNNAEVTDEISQIKVKIITVPDNAIDKVEAALQHNPNVKYVERDWILEQTDIPNDSQISSQWQLAKIGVFDAWNVTHGNSAPIAILDTGVNSTHPDLSSKIQNGWNFYDNNSDYSDSCGHGTMVAGVAAAITNNVEGVAGVAWDNPIMPIKITDPSCYGYASTMAKGITYAADNGAKVANISFQIYNGQVLTDAAKYMNSKGGVVVAAAGNTGVYENYPDNPYIISVGATDKFDNIAGFSSSGPYVDISAPGVAVYTACICVVTEIDSSGSHTNTTYYTYTSGTSFASPIVAGAMALILSANPLATPDQAYNALKTTAVDLGISGRDDYYGWGRIDVNGAVNNIKNITHVIDTVPPTVTISSPSNSTTVNSAFTVTGDATDNVKLSKVELFVNGVSSAQSTVSPYSFAIDYSKLKSGNNAINVKAYDANSNTAASEVIVNLGDIEAPSVSITSPSSGDILSAKTVISISASDNYKVSKVDIFIDGTLKSTVTSSPYQYSWNVKPVSSGAHVILAKATDSNGNTAQTTITVFRK